MLAVVAAWLVPYARSGPILALSERLSAEVAQRTTEIGVRLALGATQRQVVRLAGVEGESVEEASLRYLNRLSDLLFVMARYENRQRGIDDPVWDSRA